MQNLIKLDKYSFYVSVKKCGESCNAIDDPYVWIWVPDEDEVKNMNVKVFNLMPEKAEIKFLDQREPCDVNVN